MAGRSHGASWRRLEVRSATWRGDAHATCPRCSWPRSSGRARLGSARADEPVKKYQVVTPKDDGIIATGINNRGDIVGFEWIEEKERPGVLDQVPFFARGKQITYLPLLKGYTATFPADVSDDGTVVGRASKPAPKDVRVPLRNQAFVWDAKGGIRGLGDARG